MRFHLCLIVFLAGSSVVQAAVAPPVVDEQGQPVAANVQRVRDALAFLGAPLPPAVDEPLARAVADQDAVTIQKVLDEQVTFVVGVNPKSRVKVAEGPRVPPLQQAGWTPLLVKVVNEATVKKRLGVSSPRAGPVYGGQDRDRKDPAADPTVVRRFADVEMFTGPPMKADLSGLKVEYAIVLVASSEAMTVLKYGVEVSGFGSQALGHVNLLNLRDQTYPGSDGTKVRGWPTWTTPLMLWAKTQGAVTGYAHSANGLGVDAEACTSRLFAALDREAKGYFTKDDAAAAAWPLPEPFAALDADADGRVMAAELRKGADRQLQRLPNLNIPEMNGIGAQEICVTTALGVCDFISAMDTNRVQEWDCWYHILNCGFPLKASGETDFPCITGSRVGQGRMYVHLGRVDAVDYAAFCRGIAAGRSYVSDGYAHCFGLALGDGTLGDTVKATAGATLPLVANVAFDPDMPLGTAIGGGPPAGRTRMVELVVNGQVADKREVPADRRLHEVRFDVPIHRSAWVALRSFPQLHTNPVFVSVDGKPVRGSKESAMWCVGVIERLWEVRGKGIAESERPQAERAFREAIDVYSRIASEAD